MMQANLSNSQNQICPPCSHCGASEFFTKRKDFQVGAYCQRCQRWIKWISKELSRELGDNFHSQPPESVSSAKPKPYPQITESIRLDLTPTPDLPGRIERLEVEIDKINRVLLFHTRILGQGPGSRQVAEFGREITDELVVQLGQELAEGEAAAR
jgi:hypothetical protein